MREILKTLVMAERFCEQSNCGLCREALKKAQNDIVLIQQPLTGDKSEPEDITPYTCETCKYFVGCDHKGIPGIGFDCWESAQRLLSPIQSKQALREIAARVKQKGVEVSNHPKLSINEKWYFDLAQQLLAL